MVDIDAGVREHGVADDDLLYALRDHWPAFETDALTITVHIGPAGNAERHRRACSPANDVDAELTQTVHAARGRPAFMVRDRRQEPRLSPETVPGPGILGDATCGMVPRACSSRRRGVHPRQPGSL